MRSLLALLLGVGVLACGDDAMTPDAGTDAGLAMDASLDATSEDAGGGDDAGGTDAGRDAGTDAGGDVDGGTDSGPLPDAPAAMGFGTLAGPCGMIAAELDEVTPSLFVTRLDFMMDAFDPDDPDDVARLTPGGRRILESGGLSDSSLRSEVFAYEVLARCQGAALLKTETEIVYDTEGKKTDALVAMTGDEGEVQVGVSVVRAVRFPPGSPYGPDDARPVIQEKLEDVLAASMNVSAEDAWVKQILIVMAYADMHAESVQSVWESFAADVRADTIVYVVITDGDDEELYFSR